MDNREFFNQWAQTYDTHLPRFPEYQELVSHIVDTVAFASRRNRRSRILEIGIGTGIIAKLVQAICPCAVVYGLDNSKEMMNRIETSAFRAIELYEADMAAMPFMANQFDVIYSNFTIHHVEDKQKVLGDIHRFL